MTAIEQVTQLALLGGTLREVEATIGRQLAQEERAAFDKARMIAKVRAAKDRQERERKAREAQESLFTPEQYALGEAEIAAKQAEAEALAQRRAEREARGRPMSSAERVAEYNAMLIIVQRVALMVRGDIDVIEDAQRFLKGTE